MQKLLENRLGKSHSLTDYAMRVLLLVVLVGILAAHAIYSRAETETAPADARVRAREIGIKIGNIPTGTHNAITDVAGVKSDMSP